VLVRECGAFLVGSLALESSKTGQSPRHWEWLNLLAHGSEEQVTALANDDLATEPRTVQDTKWFAALSFLAAQMLDVIAAGGATLAEVQRSVLVPLELELASNHSNELLVPAALVRRVLDRLTTRELRQR
jgi:hypothetical protein